MFLLCSENHISPPLSTPGTQAAKSEARLNPECIKEELQSIWNISSSLINLLKFQYYPFFFHIFSSFFSNEAPENSSCGQSQLVSQQANPFLIIWGWCFICKRVMYHKEEKWKKRQFQEMSKAKSILVKTFLRDFNISYFKLFCCSCVLPHFTGFCPPMPTMSICNNISLKLQNKQEYWNVDSNPQTASDFFLRCHHM